VIVTARFFDYDNEHEHGNPGTKEVQEPEEPDFRSA
jgi:hypothetical protein